MPPRISLIISAYNRAKYISAAIKSVLNQTRGDFELIVRDDGSTDDSLAIAQATARGDRRVRVISGENLGQPLSINHAAALASAPYFGWVDSDDMLAENALKETAAILDAHPNVGLVYTDYLNIDETATLLGPGRRSKTPYTKDRLLIDFMTFHFRLMRRELFDKAGQLDGNFRYAEDYDLCLKLSELTQFHHVQKPLYMYRVHADSISQRSRHEQIQASARAVRSALARRGMDREYELEVKLKAEFRIRKKRG
jgi:glycosyltransferase involved in cell wall biosynthesis